MHRKIYAGHEKDEQIHGHHHGLKTLGNIMSSNVNNKT
jgi:calcineurin-like phosphoesterase family protein